MTGLAIYVGVVGGGLVLLFTIILLEIRRVTRAIEAVVNGQRLLHEEIRLSRKLLVKFSAASTGPFCEPRRRQAFTLPNGEP